MRQSDMGKRPRRNLQNSSGNLGIDSQTMLIVALPLVRLDSLGWRKLGAAHHWPSRDPGPSGVRRAEKNECAAKEGLLCVCRPVSTASQAMLEIGFVSKG